MSHEQMTKIKVVDLDELYNFVVANYSIWNHFLPQNSIWGCHILKFKFQLVQTKSDGEMNYTTVVDLNKLYNFVADDSFN